MSRFLRCSSAIYRKLLWVCPKDLQRDFGTEMALVFADDLAETWMNTGIPGAVRVWSRAAGELLGIALSQVAGARGMLVSAICCGLSAICLGGELMLARAHASPAGNGPALMDAVLTVVVWPSLTAALVSFVAVRVGARHSNLSLLADTQS